jgi:hypothetical protein
MRQNKLGFLVLLLLTVLMAGCDSDGSHGFKAVMRIKGVVTAGEPIEAATVSVSTLDGQLINVFPDETGRQGTFLISVPRLLVLSGYRVEVSGGTLAESGIPFEGTLRAVVDHEVRDERRLLHVGFASTVLAGYMDRHPQVDTQTAEAAVADFLGIPETLHLLTDLFFCQVYFSEDEFFEQALQSGGLDLFVDIVLDEMDAGDQDGRSFAPPPVAGSASELVLKPFVKGLVQGAASEVGSRATGWVLDQIFGDSDSPEYPTDPAVLSAIAENGTQIRELRSELEDFEKKLNSTLQAILTQTERNEYTTLVTALTDDIVTLQRQQETLWFISTHLDDPDESEWKAEAEDLLAELNVNDLDDTLRKFQRILGGADTSSAIEVWGFLNTRYAVAEQNHEALFYQFQMYANLQATALNLLLEKRHQSDTGLSPEHYVDLYLDGMTTQADIFLKRVEGMMAVSQHRDCGIKVNNRPYIDDWYAYENDYVHFILLISDTRESETLVQADTIVGSALGRDQAVTLRLADYMWMDSIKNPSWLADVPVTLINIDSGVEYAPDNVYRNRIDLPETDYEATRQLWDINRYEFVDLPVGSYAIKNVNDSFPQPDGRTVCKLIHQEYLNQQVVMAEDCFHNLLMSAYAGPTVVRFK